MATLDEIDLRLINNYQQGFPLCHRPYAEVGQLLGIAEAEVIARIRRLLEAGILSRFGPLYDIAAMGGEFTLCALQVPEERFEEVSAQVNACAEVAHNYARAHRLNMWFVTACESPAHTQATLALIEQATGLRVYPFPKQEEFYVGLYLEAKAELLSPAQPVSTQGARHG